MEESPGAGHLGYGVPAMSDLELAGTVAGSAEEQGYSTVWTNDSLPADGIAVAAAMLVSTERIRVGIGAVPCDRRAAADVARQLLDAAVPLGRLMVVVGAGATRSVEAVSAAVAELRDRLGPDAGIGVAAMGSSMCRLGGRIADLVLLNWMNPDRIRWARTEIRAGAEDRQEGLRASDPEVASYIRVSLGQGAALRLGAEAARYAALPQYAANFQAMGVASVGIAAPDPTQGPALLVPYTDVLDEAVVRPIVTMPTSEAAALEEVFEALGVLMEVSGLFAPIAAA